MRLRKDGYVEVRVNGQAWLEHRWVWAETYGEIPPEFHVHHINGIKHDNRIENLTLMHIRDHGGHHSRQRPPQRHSDATRAKLSAIARARKGTRRKPCTVTGCSALSIQHAMCNMHLLRWKAHGDPLVTLRVGRDPVSGQWTRARS